MFTSSQRKTPQHVRIIKYLISIMLISLIGFFIVSCVMPIAYGSYYHPTYPEKTKHIWFPKDNEGAGPQASIRMRSDGCYMGFRANADEENFMFTWSQEERGDNCQIQADSKPIIFEDLHTGDQRVVGIYRRVFQGGPGLDINQTVDLRSLIPGFATVPKPEQRYSLSISLRRDFNSSLPEVVNIQLPTILIGKKLINPPPIRLERHKDMLSNYTDYIPVPGKKATEIAVYNEFSGSLFDAAYVWYEDKSLYRFAANFYGFEYKDVSYKSDNSIARISGRIHIEIIGGEPLYITNNQVKWRHSDENSTQLISIEKSQWNLAMYTTTDLSERHEYLTYYNMPGIAINDTVRHYAIVIPDYKPKKFKILLPRIIVNGHNWPVQPIEFGYRYGGVGLWGM